MKATAVGDTMPRHKAIKSHDTDDTMPRYMASYDGDTIPQYMAIQGHDARQLMDLPTKTYRILF